MSAIKLPSWRPGATRDAIESFLDAAEMLPVEQRVATFDVDGTLWCEKPLPVLIMFLQHDLRAAVAERPELADRPEYEAAMAWDPPAIQRLGTINVMLALLERYAGTTPEAFESRARDYLDSVPHPDRSVPYSQTRYRPMLELIAELRARDFSVYLVTGSGLEFIRAVSEPYFGVRPEGIIGSQISYELVHDAGVPRLVRTRELVGDPNDGAAKVANIQRLIGRRPILAAGNSTGDKEMLEYVQAFDGPSLALLVEHDDADREYVYANTAIDSDEVPPIIRMAREQGWTVTSMRDDWDSVYADS